MEEVIDKSLARKAYELIGSVHNVLLVGHPNPDGDCIGSTTAMRGFLTELGCNVKILVPTRIPEYLHFLYKEPILQYNPDPEGCIEKSRNTELVICMDFNKLSRIDNAAQLVEGLKVPRILIDHHLNPEAGEFDVLISKCDISSASEVAYWLMLEIMELYNNDIRSGKKQGKIMERLNMEISTSLYTGMMTDTNNFDNSVYPSTYIMASNLLSNGIDRDFIQWSIYNAYRENRVRLMGYLTGENMKIDYSLGASCMTLGSDIQQKYDFSDGDTEGMVNIPLTIKDVMISGFFTQYNDIIRVSLRSKGKYTVNGLAAKYFNGGGHPRAAGGRLYGIPFEKVEEYFFNSLREYISQMTTE